MLKFLAATATVITITATSAFASAVYLFEEQGGDVVGTLSGSLDLTGANKIADDFSYTSLFSLIDPNSGFLIAAPTPPTVDFYEIDQRLTFGSGGFQSGIGSTTGDAVTLDGFGPPVVGLPSDYESGDELSATFTIPNATFLSLGIVEGTYTLALTGGSDTFSLQFGGRTPPPANVIPLPAGLPLLLVGLGGLAMIRRR